MKRRKFILGSAAATAATLPIVAWGQQNKPKAPKPGKGFLVKSKESRLCEKTTIGTSPNDIKVSTKDTGGDLTIFEYTGNDKGGPPLHIHLLQDEIFYIVEGDYIFQVGDQKFIAKSGDTVFAPRQVPHAFAQTSAKGKMFYLVQPSGKMEDFFRTIGNLKGQPGMEAAAKIFADHDMKMVGAPLQF